MSDKSIIDTYFSFEVNAFQLRFNTCIHFYLPWNMIDGTVVWASIHSDSDLFGRYRWFTKKVVLKPDLNLHLLRFLYTAHPWLKPLLAKRWVFEAERLYKTESEESSQPSE